MSEMSFQNTSCLAEWSGVMTTPGTPGVQHLDSVGSVMEWAG